MAVAWWRFFGDLMVSQTTNPWYRWALIKMITPSEYMECYIRKPANDNGEGHD